MISDELSKLRMLEKNSAEFNTTRGYLDWLTSLPWGKGTTDSLDVAKAKVNSRYRSGQEYRPGVSNGI